MQPILCRQKKGTYVWRGNETTSVKITSQQNKEDGAVLWNTCSLRPPRIRQVIMAHRDEADKNTSYSIYWTRCMSGRAHLGSWTQLQSFISGDRMSRRHIVRVKDIINHWVCAGSSSICHVVGQCFHFWLLYLTVEVLLHCKWWFVLGLSTNTLNSNLYIRIVKENRYSNVKINIPYLGLTGE